jgi:hypothetical protein
MRLETLHKEVSALKKATSSIAANTDHGLGMHSIETEAKRLERAARVQRFALSPRSPTGSPKRHPLKAPIHLTGRIMM